MSNVIRRFLKTAFVFQLIIGLTSLSINAQQASIDSILPLVKGKLIATPATIKLLTDLSYLYHEINPDSTTIFANQALELAKSINYKQGEADALKQLAIGCYVKAENELAIKHNESALLIYESLGDLKGKAAILNNIAIIYHEQHNYPKAIFFYEKSLDIRKKINDLAGIGACYNNIGNVNTELGNYSEALVYLFKSLAVREKIGHKPSLANSYANISGVYLLLAKLKPAIKYGSKAYNIYVTEGNRDGLFRSSVSLGAVYNAQKKHDSAMYYFNQALASAIAMNAEIVLHVCYNNIAQEFLEQQKYDSAMSYFSKALAVSQKFGDVEGIAVSTTGLGHVYLDTKKYAQAITFLQQGLDLAISIGEKHQAYLSCELLAEAYEKNNNPEQANLYLKKFILYKDSLFNDETNLKAEQYEFAHTLEKKQKEIELLEKNKSIQDEKSNLQQIIGIGLVVIIALLILFMLIQYVNVIKERKSKNVILEQKHEIETQAENLKELNDFKDITFSVLSHDLRAPLASLTQVVDMLDHNLMTPAEFSAVRIDASSRLKTLNILLENILQWAKNHIKGPVKPNVSRIKILSLVDQNFALFMHAARQKNIMLSHSVNPNLHVNADINHLDIILRNMLSNAIKFTGNGGKILVEAAIVGNTINISVTDSGIGMDEHALNKLFTYSTNHENYGTGGERGTGIGLILCKEFAELNGGSIKASSTVGAGSTFTVVLPLV